MSTLQELFPDRETGLVETSVAGIFYPHAVSFKVFKDITALFKELGVTGEDGDDADLFVDHLDEVALFAFQHILCDGEGNQFKGIETADDLLILTKGELIAAVSEALEATIGDGDEAKKPSRSMSKSKPTSTRKGSRQSK